MRRRPLLRQLCLAAQAESVRRWLRLLTVVAAILTRSAPLAASDAPPFLPPEVSALRAPAYPLVTHDPYFSIWSNSDQLAGDVTRHWSGAVKALTSMVRIDGRPYRLMGTAPASVAALHQVSVHITPTRTVYTFAQNGVELRLIFLSPLLPEHLDWLSRPGSYLIWQGRAIDGQAHDVAVYFDHSADLVVDHSDEPVAWRRLDLAEARVLRIGSVAQPVLGKAGDLLSINWGYLYQAAPSAGDVQQAVGEASDVRRAFAMEGALPPLGEPSEPRPASDGHPVLATSFKLPQLNNDWAERYLILAYDDLYSVEYMHQKLRPYWRRSGGDAAGLLRAMIHDYPAVVAASEAFDAELVKDLEAVGGHAYARLATLAYRQTWAAHKLVAAPDGSPWLFSKENSSNGCMSTIDVSFPAAPFFLMLSPRLLRGLLTPVLDYAQAGRWKFPFAPHDIGTYPLGNGQVYGGGEESEIDQMPVEETGNMLILMAAISQAEGSLDYPQAYWPLLAKWADYLVAAGFDPVNQLASEDFAGHLAHNTNLSAKAIIALSAYARLCEQTGRMGEAIRMHAVVGAFTARWLDEASDGNHTRLAFDKPGSWSAKYNMVWDKVLGLDNFPQSVLERESSYYQSVAQGYGLPLDSRASYTLLHTAVWGAAVAGVGPDFANLMQPIANYLEQTPSRIPLSDWFDTVDGRSVGFEARSVVGGVYLPMLYDRDRWIKWRSRSSRGFAP